MKISWGTIATTALFVATWLNMGQSQIPQVTVIGGVTSGHCTGFASTLQLQDTGGTCGTNGTMALAGPAPQLTLGANGGTGGSLQLNGATSAAAVLASTATGNFNITNSVGGTAALNIGTDGSQIANINLSGSTSGHTTLTPLTAAAGTITIPNGNATLATTGNIAVEVVRITGVNFNSANTDNSISLTLPPGVSRWISNSVRLNNCSASASTATAGVFTASGGGGIAIASTQAITVTTAAADTNNNAQSLALNNSATEAYTDTTVFFRVGTAQGSAVTCDVTFAFNPQT